MSVNYNLSLISQYRTHLMGLASLMIIACHSCGYGVVIDNVILRNFLIYNNIGVDIFLFLSGVGCFYSLSNWKQSKTKWLKRRLIRIVIPYTICMAFQWLFCITIGKFDLYTSILSFLTLGFWLYHQGYWFIALLVPVYLSAPCLFSILNYRYNRLFIAFIIIMLLIILCAINVSFCHGLLLDIIHNIQGAFMRISSFILGMAISPYIKNNKKINLLYVLFLTVGLIFLCRLFPLKLFIVWCEVPMVIIILTLILNVIQYSKLLLSFVFWLGTASLESYITNGSLEVIAKFVYTLNPRMQLFRGHYFEYFIVVVGGLLCTYFFHEFSLLLKKKYSDYEISRL